MKCYESIDIMLDVVYGEEVDPGKAYEFFGHLKECQSCDLEFREMAETRASLGSWIGKDITQELPQVSRIHLPASRFNWWGTVQKIAASLLIAAGAVAAGQAVGIIPQKQVQVPEAQLTRMINDIVVERQSEGWMVIGKALVSLKEDVDARDRQQAEVFYEDLNEIEERFIKVLEQSQSKSRELTSQ
jgi:hypothetical protein